MLLLHLARHAATGVAHRYLDILSDPDIGVLLGVALIDKGVAGFDRRLALAGHRILGVDPRLRIAASIWLGSTSTCHRSAPATMWRSMFSPKVRRKKSDIPPIDRLTLVGRRSSGCRRAKASSRWVSIAARCAPVAALAI